MLGVSVIKYNYFLSGRDPRGVVFPYSNAQLDLDARLKTLNEEIFVLNRTGNLNTPKFDRRLFNNYRNRGVRCSYNILNDGLHPNGDFCREMIEHIARCDRNPFFLNSNQ